MDHKPKKPLEFFSLKNSKSKKHTFATQGSLANGLLYLFQRVNPEQEKEQINATFLCHNFSIKRPVIGNVSID